MLCLINATFPTPPATAYHIVGSQRCAGRMMRHGNKGGGKVGTGDAGFLGRRNKLAQAWWLPKTETSLTALEVSPTSRRRQGWFPLGPLRKYSSLSPRFWRQQKFSVFVSLYLPNIILCLCLTDVSLCLCLPFFLKEYLPLD